MGIRCCDEFFETAAGLREHRRTGQFHVTADDWQARALAADSLLPLCSAEERWQRETTWAVMKDGNIKATKLCKTEAEAVAIIGEAKKMHVEQRPGLAVRCQEQPRYCPVRAWCIARNDGQWQPAELLATNTAATETAA